MPNSNPSLKDLPPRATARREDQLHDALLRSGQIGRREELLRATGFARVDASNAYVFHGCASVVEYGRRLGYGSKQTADYAAAGRLIERCPAAEALLLDGSMCVSTLAIIEPLFTNEKLRLLDDEGLPYSDAALLAWARVRSDRALRRTILRRREEVRVGESTAARTVHLSAQGVDDLDRTQVLVSRAVRHAVSCTEAVEHALRYYVARHDLREKTPRARRSAPMPTRQAGSRNPRYVPAEVRRALMEEHDDVCAIEGCEHRFWLENSHHVAHASGGGNEVGNQERLCRLHHRMKDHGEIVWVPAADSTGLKQHHSEQPRSGQSRSGQSRSGQSRRGHYATLEGAILRIKPPAERVSGDPPRTSQSGGPLPGGPTQEAADPGGTTGETTRGTPSPGPAATPTQAPLDSVARPNTVRRDEAVREWSPRLRASRKRIDHVLQRDPSAGSFSGILQRGPSVRSFSVEGVWRAPQPCSPRRTRRRSARTPGTCPAEPPPRTQLFL